MKLRETCQLNIVESHKEIICFCPILDSLLGIFIVYNVKISEICWYTSETSGIIFMSSSRTNIPTKSNDCLPHFLS